MADRTLVESMSVGVDTIHDAASQTKNSFGVRDFGPAGLVSGLLHTIAVLLLAMIFWGPRPQHHALGLVVRQIETATPPLDVFTAPPNGATSLADHSLVAVSTFSVADVAIALTLGDAQTGETPRPVTPIKPTELMTPANGAAAWLRGRSAANRAALLAAGGGSQQGEQAVARGLNWLIAHQLEDGGWRFDHGRAPQCGGQCSHPGTVGSSTGATALALLPLLGAGHTHLDGEHRQVVQRGLNYLKGRMIATKHGGDLQEGTMYAHGLAAICLGEAYAMTDDSSLREYAQAAIDFIVYAQHPAGGWRYFPGQPGDTTSFGWQLMALKSGQLAGLRVPRSTLYAAEQFLDQVQSDDGARYGYQDRQPRPTTTAIGLLCRIYLDRPQDHPALRRGIERLTAEGPSAVNLYYNYYAGQVLHHDGGPDWRAWNGQLRDHLIATQATLGHEAGSWYFDEPTTRGAGRLYHTAMAVLNLEVSYRYLPLFGSEVVAKP